MEKYNLCIYDVEGDQVAELAVFLTQLGVTRVTHYGTWPATPDDPPADTTFDPAPGHTYPVASAEVPKMTLVDAILKFADHEGGVYRSWLKTWAAENGFNVGSVSPTLVKLAADKKIVRIGKGVYATRRPGRRVIKKK